MFQCWSTVDMTNPWWEELTCVQKIQKRWHKGTGSFAETTQVFSFFDPSTRLFLVNVMHILPLNDAKLRVTKQNSFPDRLRQKSKSCLHDLSIYTGLSCVTQCIGFFFFGRARRNRNGLMESRMCHRCRGGPTPTLEPPPLPRTPLHPGRSVFCVSSQEIWNLNDFFCCLFGIQQWTKWRC